MKSEAAAFKKAEPKPLFFEKFTPEQIDKLLDNGQRELDNRYRLQGTNRWFNLVYVMLSLGVLFFLIVFFLPKDKDFLVDFLTLLIVFTGGLGSGYGLKSYQEKKR